MWNKYDNASHCYKTQTGGATAASFSAAVPTVSVSGSVKAYRPEQENRWALPQHEFGLDVIVLVGAVRYP